MKGGGGGVLLEKTRTASEKSVSSNTVFKTRFLETFGS